jgi:multidrug efflux system outer membrane protein
MTATARWHRLAAPAAVALLLAGCTVMGPDYERPPVGLPPAYPAAGVAAGVAAGTDTAIAGNWWTTYDDPRLNGLVERALVANADIAQAVARVEQTSGAVREVGRSRLRGSGTVRGGSVGIGSSSSESDLFVTISAAYELDFWGRLRRGDESANASYLASAAAGDTVRQTVVSMVVQGWFAVISLDAQAAALRVTLKSREDAVRIFGQRLQGGTVSRLDVEQAELQRADVALQLREVQRQRALAEAMLGLLTAEPGLVLPVNEAASLASLPALPPLPDSGLPSSLLERRPDVQRAEQLLVASNAQIGVARAAMFPQITLNGTLGGESIELTKVLESPTRFWALGVGLTLPIFEQGRLAARVDQAGARQREAVAAYQEAVGSAFKDVADALANLAAASESQAEVAQRERTAQRALVLAQARFDAGYSSYLELLEAQRTAVGAQRDAVRNRQAQLNASVDLIKALGGGWAGLPQQ